jgi:phosphatidate cytidylyltransferase
MKQRLITAGIGVVLFFCVLFAPTGVFSAAVLLVTCIAAYEIHNAVKSNLFLTIMGFVTAILIFVGLMTGNILTALVFSFSVYLILSVVLFGKCEVQKVYMLGFTSIVFSVSLSTLAVIRSEFAPAYVLLPFLFAWITDSGAYFFGITLGRHKLVPHLSPKKTLEGSLGGFLMCILISLLYTWIVDEFFDIRLFEANSYVIIAVVSAVASIISQIGDLTLSAIKREFNVKDYGNILPGHGGVLDRFDSLIFVAPFVYFILIYFH